HNVAERCQIAVRLLITPRRKPRRQKRAVERVGAADLTGFPSTLRLAATIPGPPQSKTGGHYGARRGHTGLEQPDADRPERVAMHEVGGAVQGVAIPGGPALRSPAFFFSNQRNTRRFGSQPASDQSLA